MRSRSFYRNPIGESLVEFLAYEETELILLSKI